MTTDIASGGTSNFLATKKYFRANHTTAKERVVVFVEDEIDSVFWRQFFDKYGTDISADQPHSQSNFGAWI